MCYYKTLCRWRHLLYEVWRFHEFLRNILSTFFLRRLMFVYDPLHSPFWKKNRQTTRLNKYDTSAAEVGYTFIAPDPTSNFCKGPCLHCSCLVIILQTFDFEHTFVMYLCFILTLNIVSNLKLFVNWILID